jgi:rSAM-associated Gly-rich repeat protein
MASAERRRFLKGLLGALAGAAGTVVLAATEAKAAEQPQPEPGGDIRERADRIAEAAGTTETEALASAFVNRGFRNGVGGGAFRNAAGGFGGGFRNGGFANGFGGGFRNGGFANGFGGGFRNGAFRNW